MDDKFENNDIIYYKLDGGFITQIKTWWQKRKELNESKKQNIDTHHITNIKKGISAKKKEMCSNPGGNNRTCKITHEQINSITRFLAYELPKCKQLGIQLVDIQNGQIIGSGSFGYTFKVKDTIIKIILCASQNNTIMQHEMQNEIEIHKKLMNTEYTKYFIKLFGYINNNNNKYTYNSIDSRDTCEFNKQNCETYVFLEAGDIDLETKIKIFLKLSKNEKKEEQSKITEKFYDLLNFYNISSVLLTTEEKKVFIHADIKPANIVCVKKPNDSDYDLKLIDFGLSVLSTEFIHNTGCSQLYFYYYMGEKKEIPCFTSPVYDVFCLILSYVQFLLYNNKNIFKFKFKYDKLIKKLNILITDEGTKLKMYKLICIGWLFKYNIFNKNYIINGKQILCSNCNITKNIYKYMDEIIQAVCNCTNIQDIFDIKCNDITFESIIKKS